MKALILAAGLGTRLRPLTETCPKPLLPIAGTPLLKHHLDQLKRHGINKILINTHYLHEQVEVFVEKYLADNPEIQITTVFEATLLGSAGTLQNNVDFFNDVDDFFIIYGDNLTDINYTKLFNSHLTNKNDATIACYKEESPEEKGIIEFDEDKRILKFIEKPLKGVTESNWANSGIYVFSNTMLNFVVNLVTEKKIIDFGYDIFPASLQNHLNMAVYPMEEHLLDIGTHQNYTKSQLLIKKLNLN
jgi:NDP-sugar pyrophosphorylase family protein